MNKFTSVEDVDNVSNLVADALKLKSSPFIENDNCKGKSIALLFLNPSLRTRMSTIRAATNLGMNTMVLDLREDSWKLEFLDGKIMEGDKAEHVKEAAPVIAQYAEIIGIRSFAGLKDRAEDYGEQILTAFCQYFPGPVVSLESATLHPLQSLADLITIQETKTKDRPRVVLTWAPHPRALPQAVANSTCEWMHRYNQVDFVVANPEGYNLSKEFTTGIEVFNDQAKALEGADFVIAKNWSSYESYGKVLRTDNAWCITPEKMAKTDNGKFMHCLPVRRNVVVADEVIDGENSLVIQQAGNRVWSAQTVIKKLL